MKPIWKDIWIALFMGAILPGLVLNIAMAIIEKREAEPEDTMPQTVETQTGKTEAPPITMRFRGEDGAVEEMDLDAYLAGVVCAEMPASFETEALKAQAVVARTYTLKAVSTGGKHGDGSVCGDSTCCQAYLTEEQYRARGGSDADLEKIRGAVAQTSGYVLTYEGKLIEATYFSCSGGSTEDAAAVWGTEFPYLKATSSPGEENATYYTDTVYITKAKLMNALGVSLSDAPEEWFGYTTYTAGGGVNSMIIGGKEFKGTQLRQLLGLRSTAFTVAVEEGGVTITTRGYGHRVGMSQYGADAMAVTGSTYSEILAYYYKGTMLQRWEEN